MKSFEELLAKEMTRKEFMMQLGVIILAVTGVSGLLKNLIDAFEGNKHRSHGYGSSAYGGNANRN